MKSQLQSLPTSSLTRSKKKKNPIKADMATLQKKGMHQVAPNQRLDPRSLQIKPQVPFLKVWTTGLTGFSYSTHARVGSVSRRV